MAHYIIVVYNVNVNILKRVLKALERNSSRVVAIAVLVNVEDPRVLGGIKNIDKENIVVFRGYMPLPQS